MTEEGHIPVTPSRKTLFTVVGAGLVAAAAILMGAVLPAEYQIDPLGIGKATGLLQMSRPAEVETPLTASDGSGSPARFYAAGFRTDTVDIPLAAAGDADGGDDLEWKVRMKDGETLIYSWSVDAPAEEFYSDFHGESAPSPDVKLATYKKGAGVESHGSVTAPFDGIHGWYLQNQAEKPVVVRLKLSGFYEMPPDPYAASK
jgi:hypothetical protein